MGSPAEFLNIAVTSAGDIQESLVIYASESVWLWFEHSEKFLCQTVLFSGYLKEECRLLFWLSSKSIMRLRSPCGSYLTFQRRSQRLSSDLLHWGCENFLLQLPVLFHLLKITSSIIFCLRWNILKIKPLLLPCRRLHDDSRGQWRSLVCWRAKLQPSLIAGLTVCSFWLHNEAHWAPWCRPDTDSSSLQRWAIERTSVRVC